VALLGLAVVCVLSAAGCRQDMQDQPKFIPLRSNDFYADHRSARDPLPGTVPWTKTPLNEDVYFFSGKRGNAFGNDLPANIKFDRALLARGQDRYNIYCTPCHSVVGDGNGMIVQRGYRRPPSLHDPRLRNAPLGYFFDVMSNGLGAMPDYASQIKPEDRWAITAYIRALQLSQNARESDMAAQDKATPGPSDIRMPDTSATPQKPGAPATMPQGGKQ
jgi:mono/diheme cytochrome c family protein